MIVRRTEDYDLIVTPEAGNDLNLRLNISVPTFNGGYGDLGQACDVVTPSSLN